MASSARGLADVRRYLLGDAAARPDVADLRSVSMAGHAFGRLPNHPQRDELRMSFVMIAARHLAARQAVAELVRAWNAVDVDTLVFKGFHLAEFVYASAGQRAYADVDALIDDAQSDAAFRAAEALGWEIVWRVERDEDLLAVHGHEYRGHEVGQIRRADIDLAVDLHRRVVHNDHNRVRPHPVAERLTRALWASAAVTEWEGAVLRVPTPVDAVVFGLALNRCWGSDAWQVKPRDYADLEAIVERHGVTSDAVLERARELGVATTVATYLRRCDPSRRCLDVGRPSWWTLRRWNLATARERGPHDLVTAWMALVDAIEDAAALARCAPLVARSQRLAARGADAAVAHRPVPRSSQAMTTRRWRKHRRAIERIVKWRRVDARHAGSVAALAGHALLCADGVDASLERVRRGEHESLRLMLGERAVAFTFDRSPFPEAVDGNADGTRAPSVSYETRT